MFAYINPLMCNGQAVWYIPDQLLYYPYTRAPIKALFHAKARPSFQMARNVRWEETDSDLKQHCEYLWTYIKLNSNIQISPNLN